jgi:hypothetical protein
MSIFSLLILVLVGYVIWIALRPRKAVQQAAIESNGNTPPIASPAPIWNP